jgi:hypothetical protein
MSGQSQLTENDPRQRELFISITARRQEPLDLDKSSDEILAIEFGLPFGFFPNHDFVSATRWSNDATRLAIKKRACS